MACVRRRILTRRCQVGHNGTGRSGLGEVILFSAVLRIGLENTMSEERLQLAEERRNRLKRAIDEASRSEFDDEQNAAYRREFDDSPTVLDDIDFLVAEVRRLRGRLRSGWAIYARERDLRFERLQELYAQWKTLSRQDPERFDYDPEAGEFYIRVDEMKERVLALARELEDSSDLTDEGRRDLARRLADAVGPPSGDD